MTKGWVVYFEHEKEGRGINPYLLFLHNLMATLHHGCPESVSLMTKNVSKISYFGI